MSQKTILALVEALRVAGQRRPDISCRGQGGLPCTCHACQSNAKVDAAARALVAEIERVQTEAFREQRRAEEDDLLNDLRTGSKT